MSGDRPFCNRCLEDFPLSEQKQVEMGSLYPLGLFASAVRRKVQPREDGNNYLCGNCYFNLSEED